MIDAGDPTQGDALTPDGRFRGSADEWSFIQDEWGYLGARAGNVGLWGGLAFALASATDFAVLGDGPASRALLALRLVACLLGLALFSRTRRSRPPTPRLGALLLGFEVVVAVLFLAVVAVYGPRTSAEFQGVSALLLLGVLFVYGPALHRGSAWLGIGFAGAFWLECWRLLHADAAVLAVLAVLLAFAVAAGWRIAVQFNRATRRGWRDRRRLAAAEHHLRLVFQVCPVPLVLTDRDDGSIRAFNRAARELLDPGRLAGEGVRSTDFHDAPEQRDLVHQALRGQDRVGPLDLRMRRTDGSTVDVMYSAVAVDGRGRHEILSSLVEITERRQREDEMRRLGRTDGLTGLLNRTGLEGDLAEAVARATAAHQALAVGFVDLDDFQPVNDVWGHAAGDALLREFAQRLRDLLRQPALLARVGGDEFVVVIEGLSELDALAELKTVLARLHAAVEAPFELAGGGRAEVGMTMGLAMFPFDAVGADALIRQADAAMYQAKLRKVDRASWWRLGVEIDHPERGVSFDAYGAEAATLLERARGHVHAAAVEFAEAFEFELGRQPEVGEVLRVLGADARERLEARQAEHLKFLLDPETSRDGLERRAARLGQIHVLTGVGSAWLTRAQALYRKLLGEKLNQVLMPSRERYLVTLIAEARLQDDIQAELQSSQAVVESYLRFLARPLPAAGTLWIDAMRAEIDALGTLAGVIDAAGFRPDSLGVFQLEAMAATAPQALRAVALDPAYRPEIDPRSPRGNALLARAWRGEVVVSTPSYAHDPGVAHWHAAMGAAGVRSAMAFPVLGESGRPVAAVRVLGRYPNQFEAAWMRQFASSLQQRWSSLWRQCRTPPTEVVPPELAQAMRERLFAGGLRMLVQPVVDLRSGRLARVEALARLEMDDGSVMSPGVFLPQLGTAELDRLFRLGLDAALEDLGRWDAQGLSVEVSVNIAPSTLLDPDCPRWIEQALRDRAIAAHRLTLEILESQRIEAMAQDQAIARLTRLGIRLAMDDLGAGYSSLQRLAALPFSTIKVDQSLLLRVRENPKQTLSMVSTILQMGKDFERDIVVEGLEDQAMIEAVTVLGARYGQGYGLARPMPPGELAAWARTRAEAPPCRELRSVLGALAFLWGATHDGARSCAAVDACPLGVFLEARGDAVSRRLHADIHAGRDAARATHELLDILARRVQSGEA